VSRRRVAPALAALLGLLAAAAILVVVEFGLGAAGYGSGKVADPCRPRTFAGSGIDATVQRVVLDGLDGAACKLGTSREELVLSLGSGGSFPPRRWDRPTIETALRAGLLGAVDRAEQRGDIPGFVVPLLRRAIRSAPLDELIRGAISLRDLIG
jgi:hypothetical protein